MKKAKRIWFINILMIMVALIMLPFNILVVPPLMLMAFMVGLIINIILKMRE